MHQAQHLTLETSKWMMHRPSPEKPHGSEGGDTNAMYQMHRINLDAICISEQHSLRAIRRN